MHCILWPSSGDRDRRIVGAATTPTRHELTEAGGTGRVQRERATGVGTGVPDHIDVIDEVEAVVETKCPGRARTLEGKRQHARATSRSSTGAYGVLARHRTEWYPDAPGVVD